MRSASFFFGVNFFFFRTTIHSTVLCIRVMSSIRSHHGGRLDMIYDWVNVLSLVSSDEQIYVIVPGTIKVSFRNRLYRLVGYIIDDD